MVNMLVCSGSGEEVSLITDISKDVAAMLTEDKWNIYGFMKAGEVQSFIAEKSLLDAMCFDVTIDKGVSTLEQARAENGSAYVLLIANTDTSPLTYIKPGIMASSLMLRPLERGRIRYELEQLVRSINREDSTDVFVAKDKDGKNRIPYSRILCFEAREKKIYACTETKEYAFYDSLDKLSEELPAYFVRCHRGFIVNTREIIRITLSDNAIYLTGEYMVPLSRSYKGVLKEFI